jgi:hypothetical protein
MIEGGVDASVCALRVNVRADERASAGERFVEVTRRKALTRGWRSDFGCLSAFLGGALPPRHGLEDHRALLVELEILDRR